METNENIDLSSEDEATVRSFAKELVLKYVPSTTGDPRFSEIAKDYGGVGTTCGYLCHWLMWRLGVRDPKMVNRSEPEDGLHYAVGMNISRIFNNPHFVRYEQGKSPGDGDIVFISNGPPATEHVLVSVGVDDSQDPPIWSGANAGQRDPATGSQCSVLIDRTMSKGILLYNGVGKKVVGWIDISKLPFTAPANLDSPGV